MCSGIQPVKQLQKEKEKVRCQKVAHTKKKRVFTVNRYQNSSRENHNHPLISYTIFYANGVKTHAYVHNGKKTYSLLYNTGP